MSNEEQIMYHHKTISNIDLSDVNQFCTDKRDENCVCKRCYKYAIRKFSDKIIIEKV